MCSKLSDKLTAKWGAGTNHAWLDPATHQRASFDDEACKLRFERYAEPAEWVTALPLTLVNSSAEKLKSSLDGNYDDSGDPSHIYWKGPGVGYGTGLTQYDALIHNDKILYVSATTDADFDSTTKVRDAMSAKLKAQPKIDNDEYVQSYSWKKRVQVQLEISDRKMTVGIGNPWD